MDDCITPRTCNECRKPFPLTEEFFYRHPTCECGFMWVCKTCKKAASAHWRVANRAKHREYSSRYKKEHREQTNASNRRWYAETIEDRRAAAQRWRDANRERLRAQINARRQMNPEQRKASDQRYRIKNRDQINQRYRTKNHYYYLRTLARNPDHNRIKNNQRRTRLLQAKGGHTQADIELQYKSQKGLCWWCGESLTSGYHEDHRVPLTRGGSNDANNICLACPDCNRRKHNKLPHEWNGRLL